MAQFVRHDIPRKSCSFALKKISRSAMSNGAGNYELYLAVGGGADDEEVDEYRRALQWELNELEGVARVDQISAGKAPEGTRAIDLVVIGGLAVALKQAGMFDAVVSTLKAWIESGNRRKQRRKVVIKRPDGTMLEFDGYSLKEIGGFGDLPDTGGKD
jgi:Effector Associated Constant Component 1